MSDSSLKKIIPRHIEPRKFVNHAVVLQGEVAGDGLTRFAEASIKVEHIEVELAFGFDEERRRTVTGWAKANLLVECQRCLELMPYAIEADIRWAIVWDEEKARQLPARLEPWIAGEEAEDLYAMIEEELLLALPTAPTHSELCIDSTLLSSGEVVEDDEATDKNNPFLALAALKSKETKH